MLTRGTILQAEKDFLRNYFNFMLKKYTLYIIDLLSMKCIGEHIFLYVNRGCFNCIYCKLRQNYYLHLMNKVIATKALKSEYLSE